MNGEQYDLIIVGGGIGGSAAALRAVQYNLNVCWFYGDKQTSKSSRSKWVFNIDNMLGFHEGILKGELLKTFKSPEDDDLRERINETHIHITGSAVLKNTRERIESDYSDNIDIIDKAALSAKREPELFLISDGEFEARSEYVVFATGVMDKQPHVMKERGGDIVDSTKWIYPFANRETILYCIRCEGHLTREDNAAVIGSGVAAEQLSFMLYERYGIKVSILTNGEELNSDDDTKKLLSEYKIGIHTKRISDVSGEKGGQLRRFVLADGEVVEVRFALVALGLHRVYNDLLIQLGAELDDEGLSDEIRHIRVSKKSETSIPNIFAVGDMAKRADEVVMKQIYTAQEYAVRAVDSIDYRIRSKKRKKILNQIGENY
ncbi:NAD(P)/FAD-dependent oxidoreductase [Candidatus Marinimicrobia bacterium MT.SAG.3]|nr:NAD(P)/FAD-dependent oxidoreductase [Candidatus Marinimicrobia bacterium MT.SAG.3]